MLKMDFKKLLRNKTSLLIIVCIGILLLFVGNLQPAESAEEAPAVPDYEAQLENRLAAILSSVDGAGKVSVMITLEDDGEIEPVTERSSGEKEETKPLVTSQGSGKEQLEVRVSTRPRARGVVVTAEGGDNAAVRARLMEATAAVLEVPAHRIAVFKKAQK